MAPEGVGKEASSLQEGKWVGKGGGEQIRGDSSDREKAMTDICRTVTYGKKHPINASGATPIPFLHFIQIYAHFSLYFLLPSLYFDRNISPHMGPRALLTPAPLPFTTYS
jgi:hypothetical protein